MAAAAVEPKRKREDVCVAMVAYKRANDMEKPRRALGVYYYSDCVDVYE